MTKRKKVTTMPTPTNLANLSTEEIALRLELARRARETGAPMPAPVKPPRAAPRRADSARRLPDEWKGTRAKCPHCNKTKDVIEGFGLKPPRRPGDTKVARQSWCRACRSSTNYYGQPRTYAVKE